MTEPTTTVILTNPEFPSPSRRAPSGNRSRIPSPNRGRTPSRSRTRQLLEADQALNGEPPLSVPGATASAAEEEPGPSFREAVQDLAEAGARGAAKKRDATENDWAEFLTALFGFGSMLLVWFLVAGRGLPKAERRGYELTDDEASALARPAARIFARSWMNAAWGKHILGGSDYVLLALVLVEYTERISPLLKDKAQRLPRPQPRGRQSRPEAAPPPAPAPAEETRNGVVERPVDPGPVVYPANLT